MNPLWLALLAALVVAVAAAIRRGRSRRLALIRDGWGKPLDRIRRMDAIRMSHAGRIAQSAGGRSMDERTWTDLGLDEVFASLDRTQGTLGQHALYHRLRSAPLADHLEVFEALVTRMTRDIAARERAQVALSRLQDPHGYDIWWLAGPDALERRPWFALFPILTTASILLAGAAPFWPFAIAPLVATLAINIVVRLVTDWQIGAIARSIRQCAPLIATVESLQFLAGEGIDPIVGPLRADAPALARLKLISRWLNGDPLMLSVSPHPAALLVSDVLSVIYEYLNLAFLLDATGACLGVADLRRHGGALVRATAAAGEVDAAIGIASYRAARSDWTRPEFREPGDNLDLTDLRHPLVADAVPNSISIRSGRGLLVTGSNMSGKSTFLRTVGVNAVLAQTIHTCLAREYRAPVFEVRSSIGMSDDLLSGKSYYVAEIDALLGLVRASREPAPHLFVLDELFRGTNSVERIAAGQAVLEQLLEPGGGGRHVVFAATHDGELVDLVSASFEACHFGDAIGPEGLVFDHRLQRGPATTRNAIALLRLHGAPEALLTLAMATAERLDRQRGTTVVVRRW